MAANRAKILQPEYQEALMRYVAQQSSDPLRDRVMFLLSFKGGLRACEMVGLDWSDVTDARGRIGQERAELGIGFVVPGDIAKMGHERFIPMHDQLRAALDALQSVVLKRDIRLGRGNCPVLLGSDAKRMKANTLQQYMRRVFLSAGFHGCSSHSGRRTLITGALRIANQHGCSIKDVQDIAGHAFLDTTENYVEPSMNVGKLVNAL